MPVANDSRGLRVKGWMIYKKAQGLHVLPYFQFVAVCVSCISLQYGCTNGREKDGCPRSASVETNLSFGWGSHEPPASYWSSPRARSSKESDGKESHPPPLRGPLHFLLCDKRGDRVRERESCVLRRGKPNSTMLKVWSPLHR